jgi:hypothetical protein
VVGWLRKSGVKYKVLEVDSPLRVKLACSHLNHIEITLVQLKHHVRCQYEQGNEFNRATRTDKCSEHCQIPD